MEQYTAETETANGPVQMQTSGPKLSLKGIQEYILLPTRPGSHLSSVPTVVDS